MPIHETSSWRLETPEGEPKDAAPSLVLATIHPRGDQRILKCVQSILLSRASVDLIWLGGNESIRFDGYLSERCLPAATSTWQRILSTFTVLRMSLTSRANTMYVHDFYMLPHALIWKMVRRGRIIYDCHEYYPELYAAKFPSRCQPMARRAIVAVYRMLLAGVDALSVVGADMTACMGRIDKPVAVTPNYPSRALFSAPPRQMTAAQVHRVVHSGHLSAVYGAEELLAAAAKLSARASPITITAVSRFSSERTRDWFMKLYEEYGRPENLVLIDPMPAASVQTFLQGFGVGLGLLQSGGQNDLLVPTKFYEYASCGLFVCATNREGQERFLQSRSDLVAGVTFKPGTLDLALERIVQDADAVTERVNSTAPSARAALSWEASCEPGLVDVVWRTVGD